MTVEEYQVAQLYSVAEASKNETGNLTYFFYKVHIFWEGHKILRNLRFDSYYIGQIYGGDFDNTIYGLLRIYELLTVF